jgi:hypothetical protein
MDISPSIILISGDKFFVIERLLFIPKPAM